MSESALIVSLDFELGWGVLDSSLWQEREKQGLYRRMREVLPRFQEFLIERECATTWASVGSMFAKNPRKVALDHLPSTYREAVGRFVAEAETQTLDARDLMESWDRLAPFTEIASHTSTHIYASYPGVTGEQYREDVAQSIHQLQAHFGTDIESLVFTRDEADFLSEISAHHPLHCRLGPQIYRRAGAGKLQRVMRGIRRYVEAIPPSQLKEWPAGGSTQTGSMYFNWIGGDFQSAKRFQVRLQAGRVLRQLEQGEQAFHLWLHPFNLAESPQLLDRFQAFLDQVVTLRDAGKTQILTMAQFARRSLNQSN